MLAFFWMFALTLVLFPVASNEINSDRDEFTVSTRIRRSLLVSRLLNPYNERYNVDFAEINSADVYDDEYDDEYDDYYSERTYDQDDLFDEYIDRVEDDILSLIDLIESDREQSIESTKIYHVIFARHPYTIQNQNLIKSMVYDVPAAQPIGRYQLEALMDKFDAAAANGLPQHVYHKLKNGHYRLDLSPLRRAVLAGLMMAQSVYNKHQTLPRGYVLDRRLQEYQPTLCKNNKRTYCRVNRLGPEARKFFLHLYQRNTPNFLLYDSDKAFPEIWLRTGFTNSDSKIKHWKIARELTDSFITALLIGKVKFESMFKDGDINDKMSSRTSQDLLKDYIETLDEPLVVIGGHSESMKDLMTGGAKVEIDEASKKVYSNTKCNGHNKVCNCEAVYFQVDKSGSKPVIKNFKSLWKPSDVDEAYIKDKGWGISPNALETA